MAWQTPKTDWTSVDGVRDTDLNRMEGNIAHLYGSAGLQENITLYARAAGSDDTGNGSNAAPYRTITKALSTLPKNLNGKTCTIIVASDTYSESLVISDFCGGEIILSGSTNTQINLSGFTVDGCICRLNNVTVALSGVGAHVTNGGVLLGGGTTSGSTANNGLNVTGANNSLEVDRCSRVSIRNLVSNNANAYGIYAIEASHVFVTNLSGTDNNWGIGVHSGAIVAVSTNSISATEAVISFSGGRYFTDSQDFSLNAVATAEVV